MDVVRKGPLTSYGYNTISQHFYSVVYSRYWYQQRGYEIHFIVPAANF